MADNDQLKQLLGVLGTGDKAIAAMRRNLTYERKKVELQLEKAKARVVTEAKKVEDLTGQLTEMDKVLKATEPKKPEPKPEPKK